MISLTDMLVALSGVMTALTGYLLWKDAHADRGDKKLQALVEQLLTPTNSEIVILRQQVADSQHDAEQTLEDVVRRSLAPLIEKQGELVTRVAVLENTQGFLRDLMHSQAQVLHQPDPRRAHVDILLEALMEDRLTPAEEEELREYLTIIKNWEPGQDVGFPVHPGEPTSASILLATMDHVLPRYTPRR